MAIESFIHVNCLSPEHSRRGHLPEVWNSIEFKSPEVMANPDMKVALHYLLPDLDRQEIKDALSNPTTHIYLLTDTGSVDPTYEERAKWLVAEFASRKIQGEGYVERKGMAETPKAL